jgi:glyoxylase-like metal-dependent hydrolase (beta-lactamase superfamily II)
LQPDALDPDDVFKLCFQSYIVETPHHTLLVDSCLGNDKPRPRPEWHMKSDDTFLRALASAGFSVEDIDYVMCTHLHVDHVGWNTRLLNGEWVPTFPNARYVFAHDEHTFWEARQRAANRSRRAGRSCRQRLSTG